ncbi:hypothetical protein HYPSUDRAFT_867009 [Hypholoma sublateritium FD-334 SS-4]|uniref:Uncharacterized protein n=1 Tax=Hypholoma sublateritium (strain FD-334 SS-4) TaxID=945553 RepID=A0A0D2LJ45_HYPSF|nr:hypothetical protein HYPSUDRAFT_867009 [Hypholoma sublateritium FD-334 SS-4]
MCTWSPLDDSLSFHDLRVLTFEFQGNVCSSGGHGKLDIIRNLMGAGLFVLRRLPKGKSYSQVHCFCDPTIRDGPDSLADSRLNLCLYRWVCQP